MTNRRIGFIGCGNMGCAMLDGILSSGLYPPDQITASAHTKATLHRLRETYGIHVTPDNAEVVKHSDIVILAVKPSLYEAIISAIRDVADGKTLFISIAAGVSHARLNDYFGRPVKIVRAMPNTPAQVLSAMSALTPNEYVTKEDLETVLSIFESFGRAELVPESLMDAVVGVSGSSPAYVYLFLEAMADAAVLDGMPRAQAYTFAAQAVYGAAKMVLETGKHPGELKDAVCSPGGTTIAAVARLEEMGLRNAVIQAQHCCTIKSKEMGKTGAK